MVTGPWDSGTPGRNRLLASDADRERAIDVLKTAFVHGVLTRDELGLRTGQALASRTYGQLAALTADLTARAAPPPFRRPPATAPPKRPGRRPRKKVVVWCACAIVLPLLGATFFSYYGGFLVMLVFTFLGAVLTSKPPSPRRPGRPG